MDNKQEITKKQDISQAQVSTKGKQKGVMKSKANSSIFSFFTKENINHNKIDITNKKTEDKPVLAKEESDQEIEVSTLDFKVRRRIYKPKKEVSKRYKKDSDDASYSEVESEEELDEPGGPSLYDKLLLHKIPANKTDLLELKCEINKHMKAFQNKFFDDVEANKNKLSDVPIHSIPLSADITSFDFEKLATQQKKVTNRLFDVIMMDPPWQLSTAQPSRGVAIAYSSLSDQLISQIPVEKLQTAGFIFIWVINAKYSITCQLLKQWGYTILDELAWIKKTVNGKIAKGHGFYLQHAKETCLVGVKNIKDVNYVKDVGFDIIFDERRGQSQKPNSIYDIIEQLVPNGFYLEIFGRRNNLHNKWVTIGNEL